MLNQMSDCIFCKIIKGEIPSAKVFENEHVLAFLDISQLTKGHTLVIPKIHTENIFDMDAETARNLFEVVPTISNAIKADLNPEGINLLANNGETAGQEVFHFHLHLIPRYGIGDGFGTVLKSHQSAYSPQDLQAIAASIENKIGQ